MRINEEVDALEVMGVPSLPYLVTTRIIAGVVADHPAVRHRAAVAPTWRRAMITVLFNGQSAGTYDHYFSLFLPPVDVLWSFAKVLIFSVMVILAHCYYGYRASGGPAGVGRRGRPRGADRDRHDQHHRLLPQPRHLGRDHHGEGRGMSAPTGWYKTRRRVCRDRVHRGVRGAGLVVDRLVQQGLHLGRAGQRWTPTRPATSCTCTPT